ncbi:lipoyl(octanoyl) transferase [Balamuthia mandrillaris]
MRSVLWKWGGRRPYASALEEMAVLVQKRKAGAVPDMLWLVEHPPVYTYTKKSVNNFRVPLPELKSKYGADTVYTHRGGDITFHGPGQLVAYPILDLRHHKQDLRWYLHQLEEVMIETAWHWKIPAQREEGRTGIWTEDRKLGAIGIQVSQWVTSHGLALNVTTDLSYFDLIVPCGIVDKQVTSLAAELARKRRMMRDVSVGNETKRQHVYGEGGEGAVDVEMARDVLVDRFGKVFQREMRKAEEEET